MGLCWCWGGGWLWIRESQGSNFKQIRGWKDVCAVLGSSCLLPVSFIEWSRLDTFSLTIHAQQASFAGVVALVLCGFFGTNLPPNALTGSPGPGCSYNFKMFFESSSVDGKVFYTVPAALKAFLDQWMARCNVNLIPSCKFESAQYLMSRRRVL